MSLFSGLGDILSTGVVFGKNPLTKALGISGEQGDYFKPGTLPTLDPGADSLLKSNYAINNSPGVASSLSSYGQGNGSLADAFNAANANGELNDPAKQSAFYADAAVDPMSGTRMATDQVQSNGILGQLFGKDGDLSKAITEEGNLATKGYGLQDSDNEAYGQASDHIARLAGQQDQSLSQTLSDRGFGTGGGGVAGAAFSGVQGNKFEALAKAQTDIAQRRMEMNQQRLAQTRGYISQMGGLGEQSIQDQYRRNAAGVDQRNTEIDQGLKKYGEDLSGYQAQNKASQDSLDSQYAHKGQTLFDSLGNGLFQGVGGGVNGMLTNAAKKYGPGGGAAGASGSGGLWAGADGASSAMALA